MSKSDTMFKPGRSGNPKGRPLGSGVSGTLRRAIADEATDILQALIAQAKAGDVQAARVLLDRILPPLKATTPSVAVPGMARGTLTAKAKAVLSATSRGNMAPDIAAQLVAALAQMARVVETDELAARIAALERVNEKA